MLDRVNNWQRHLSDDDSQDHESAAMWIKGDGGIKFQPITTILT